MYLSLSSSSTRRFNDIAKFNINFSGVKPSRLNAESINCSVVT